MTEHWTFDYARQSSGPVAAMLKAGCSLEEIIARLAENNKDLIDEIVKLKGLCPVKYVNEDGTTLTWRCPDELIPVIELKLGGLP